MMASDLMSLKEQGDSRNYKLSVAAATGGASIDASVRQVHLNLRRLSPGWYDFFGLKELWKGKVIQNSLFNCKVASAPEATVTLSG
jgi:hypothetical protein